MSAATCVPQRMRVGRRDALRSFCLPYTMNILLDAAEYPGKRVDAPRMTPSMRIALQDLQLERIAVVYSGPRRYVMEERVEAVPLCEVAGRLGRPVPMRAAEYSP